MYMSDPCDIIKRKACARTRVTRSRNFVSVLDDLHAMSTLGKRKARSDGDAAAAPDAADGEAHGATLFISNLPYAATSVDLQTLFSDLAPVRAAFVATAPGSGVSKGVGYVSFAAREDAVSVHDQVQKDGLQMNGRSIRVGWADSSKVRSTGSEHSIMY
jgi:nucleolar protein 4